MAFEFGVWRIDNGFKPVALKGMPKEKDLEDILCEHIEILNQGWLVLGRQVSTTYHGFLDLLAIDKSGNLVVIELKRDQTPKDVVAQVLDYGAWVQELDVDDIVQIFEKYKHEDSSESFDEAFMRTFGVGLPDDLNSSHQLVIVATELDSQTERIINYLAERYSVEINVMFFRVIEDDDRQYLSRVWLIDPVETQMRINDSRAEKGEWNGEYYVSFGYDKAVVEDGIKHGYIVAGGGRWYSRTLELLSVGDRVWVNVPGNGYIGYGIVTQEAAPVDRFKINGKQGVEPISKVSSVAKNLRPEELDFDTADFLVGIDWLYKVDSLSNAKHEKGFFGNQNSVARPTAKSWNHTISRLKVLFGVEE